VIYPFGGISIKGKGFGELGGYPFLLFGNPFLFPGFKKPFLKGKFFPNPLLGLGTKSSFLEPPLLGEEVRGKWGT